MLTVLFLVLTAALTPQAQDPTAALAAAEAERASVLLAEGKTTEALAVLRAALERLRTELGEDSPEVGRALNNLAYGLSQNREFEAALEVGRQALAVMQKQGDPTPGTAMVRRNLGEIAARAGRLAEARPLLEAAVADFEATYGKTPMAAEARVTAAGVCLALGDLGAAQEHLEWAVAIQEGVLGPLNPATAQAIQQLAGALARRGQFDAALLLAEHVLQLAAGMEGAGALWAEVCSQRADWQAALGDFEGAKAELDALAAAAQPAGDAEQAMLRLDLARRYLEYGFPVEALEQLELMPVELAPLHAGARADFQARAQALLGRHAAAVAGASAALATLEPLFPGAGNDVIAGLHLRRGASRAALGQDEARADVLAALEMRRGGLGEEHPLLWEVLAAFLALESRRDRVTPELIDLVDMAEAPRANASPAQLAAWGQAPLAAATNLVHAAWRLAAQRKERLAEVFALVERERQRAQLAAVAWWVESGAAAGEPELRAYLEELHRGAQRLQPLGERTALLAEKRAALRASDSRWAALATPAGATLEQARAWLQAEDQALLCYSWTEAEVWALVLRRDPARDLLVPLGSAAVIEPELQAAQAALRDLDRACDLSALAARLLHPLWSSLADCTRVTVIADGPLAFLPLEALSIPDGGYWVRRCRLSYAPSVAALLELPAAAAAPAGALHLGPSLEHPQAVPVVLLQRIRERFAVQPAAGAARAEVLPEGEVELRGAAALESTLQSMDADGRLAALRLLHGRLLGYVDAAVPANTSLVLSPEPADDGRAVWQREDGVLDLAEVSGLHLRAALVLLPWVETGPQPDAAGLRSEGLHALVRGLWVSGARGVVLSGWTVDGVAAANFHQQVVAAARGTANPAEALWRAQQAWLERAAEHPGLNLAHPGFWARFRYWGQI